MSGRALVGLLAATACAGHHVATAPEPDASAIAADAAIDAAPLAPTSFQDSYEAHDVVQNQCNHIMGIRGLEPAEPGRYPVALFLVGTNAQYDGAGVVDHVLPLLARHGFVVASIDYENGTLFGAAQNCNLYSDNATCMIRNSRDYVDGVRSSALARVCGRATADCSKGVVLLGHSQGGMTALQAFRVAPIAPTNGDPMPRLVAIAPMGVGPTAYFAGLPVIDLSSCMTAATIQVAPRDMLVVNGEHDQHFNGANADQAGGQIALQQVTGRTCATGSYDCRGPDGDGFVLVKDSQVTTGNANHSYMDSPAGAFEEPNWSDPTNVDAWSLEHAATWLRAQTY